MALTKKQLEERRTGIGGSDAATILGLNPFNDPLALYLDKRGELPEQPPRPKLGPTYWGSLLEPPICEAYSDVTGHKLIRQNQMFRAKDHPFMIAHVDRRVIGVPKRMWMEAKSDAWGIGWGEEGTNEIPPYIMCQVQHYISVLKADQFDLAVLIGNRDYRIFSILPLPEMIETLIFAEQEFWDRVENGIPPEPNWQSDATTKLFKELYPGTDGSVILLPEIAQDVHQALQVAKLKVKEAEALVTEGKNKLAFLLGEAAAGVLPDGTVYTRKKQERKSYTVKATEFIVTRHTDKQPEIVVNAIRSGQLKLQDNSRGLIHGTKDDRAEIHPPARGE